MGKDKVAVPSPVGTIEEFNKLEICPVQEDSLYELNKYLSNKSFILGYELTCSDEAVYSKCGNNIDATKYPHVARWCSFIGSFPSSSRKKWVGEEVDVYDEEDTDEGDEEDEDSKKAKKDDDDDDDDDSDAMDFDALDNVDEDDDEETKAMMAKHAAKVKEIQKRQAAKKDKARTNITIDVNPEDQQTDMEVIQEKVAAIKIDGLKWLGKGVLVPTFYGMSKLTIQCQIFDTKVPSTQVIYDAIEEIEGVGSTREIASQMA